MFDPLFRAQLHSLPDLLLITNPVSTNEGAGLISGKNEPCCLAGQPDEAQQA
jgi:hypothetical protein